MSWFLVILFLSLTFSGLSESSHVKNKKKLLPSAVVVGTVYCDTCSQEQFSSPTSHFISGASVAVECKAGKNSKPRFRKEVKTDEHGEFKVQLPFSGSRNVKKIKGCTFRLISSSEPHCAVAPTASSTSSLCLKSTNQGEQHIFSAGLLSFKPTKKPKFCNNKKESVYVKNKFPPNIDPSFPPPLRDPPTPGNGILPLIPTIPLLPPLPQIPPLLPPLPPKDHNSNPTTKTSEKSQLSGNNNEEEVAQSEFSFFPPIIPPIVPNPFQPPPLFPNPFQPPPLIPNPFQPPPSLPNPFQPPTPPFIPNPFQPPPSPKPLIPNPFQPPPSPPPFLPNPFQPPPSPIPSPLIPNPFQPPPSTPTPMPSPLFPFPPIPGLTPSPPPPPPPAFPVPFPPLFPPLFPPPHSPGVPPAASSSSSSSSKNASP